VFRLIAAATLAIATLSCGSSLREIDGQAGAAGAARAASSTPSPAAMPAGPIGSPAAGWVRISDDAGGWSMDMPQGWFEKAAPQHGHEFRSYDPSIPLPGNYSSEGLPPVGHVLVRMQMQANPDQLDATAFFKPTLTEPRVEVREHKQVTVGGQPAELWSVWRSQPSQFQRLEPTLSWYVRSPFFDDRMVVIYAAPGESSLRSDVERIVASLQFYQPSPVSLVPTVSRQEAIDRVVSRPPGKPSTATRVEAKLVQYKEWERRQGGSRSYTTDPDTLVWVVAYVAPDITTRRGDPCAWAISVSAARPLAPGDNVGVFQCGPGTWPAWFAQLVDLSP
jgi:hypothetical protein